MDVKPLSPKDIEAKARRARKYGVVTPQTSAEMARSIQEQKEADFEAAMKRYTEQRLSKIPELPPPSPPIIHAPPPPNEEVISLQRTNRTLEGKVNALLRKMQCTRVDLKNTQRNLVRAMGEVYRSRTGADFIVAFVKCFLYIIMAIFQLIGIIIGAIILNGLSPAGIAFMKIAVIVYLMLRGADSYGHTYSHRQLKNIHRIFTALWNGIKFISYIGGVNVDDRVTYVQEFAGELRENVTNTIVSNARRLAVDISPVIMAQVGLLIIRAKLGNMLKGTLSSHQIASILDTVTSTSIANPNLQHDITQLINTAGVDTTGLDLNYVHEYSNMVNQPGSLIENMFRQYLEISGSVSNIDSSLQGFREWSELSHDMTSGLLQGVSANVGEAYQAIQGVSENVDATRQELSTKMDVTSEQLTNALTEIDSLIENSGKKYTADLQVIQGYMQKGEILQATNAATTLLQNAEKAGLIGTTAVALTAGVKRFLSLVGVPVPGGHLLENGLGTRKRRPGKTRRRLAYKVGKTRIKKAARRRRTRK